MLTSRGYIVFFLGLCWLAYLFHWLMPKRAFPLPFGFGADPDNLPFSNEDPERKGLYP
jgi:hypothetical protein